jgi:hypothetical protein
VKQAALVFIVVAALAWIAVLPGTRSTADADRSTHGVQNDAGPAPSRAAPALSRAARDTGDAVVAERPRGETATRAMTQRQAPLPARQSRPVIPRLPPELMREATDSGRAQPVFISTMAAGAVQVGKPVRFEITGESENDFARIAMQVEFDARRLRVMAVHPGSMMAQAGAIADFSYAVDPVAGRVAIQSSEKAGGPLVAGGGSIGVVEFVAVAPGPAAVTIAQVEIRDLLDRGVPASILAARTIMVNP